MKLNMNPTGPSYSRCSALHINGMSLLCFRLYMKIIFHLDKDLYCTKMKRLMIPYRVLPHRVVHL